MKNILITGGAGFIGSHLCEKLLKEKRVKFIQFEYSEHYRVSGHTLGKVSEFVEKYGYRVFNDQLLPEYEENFTLSNYIIAPVDFTENWNAKFKQLTEGMSFAFALEIGCFEGLTTNYICDNLLYEDGRIICIDPLEDEYLTENLTPDDKLLNKSLGNCQELFGPESGQSPSLERIFKPYITPSFLNSESLCPLKSSKPP